MPLIPIDSLILDGGTQFRTSLDEAAIKEYAERDAAGELMPLIDAIEDEIGKRWVTDGFHRIEARRRNGKLDIAANIEKGTQRDAQLAALTANADHGVRLRNEDKRNIVEHALKHLGWEGESDREIARRLKVSHPFVADVRSRLFCSTVPVETIPEDRREPHTPPPELHRPESGTTHKKPPQHRVIDPMANISREPGDDEPEGEEEPASSGWAGEEKGEKLISSLTRWLDDRLAATGGKISHAQCLGAFNEFLKRLEKWRKESR